MPIKDSGVLYLCIHNNKDSNKNIVMKQFVYEPKSEQDVADQLINLYGSHMVKFYPELYKLCNNNGIAYPSLPLLLWPKNEGRDWEQANITVMVFGRETNDWKDGQNKPGYNFELNNSDDVRKEINLIQDIYEGYCEYATDADKSSFTKNGFDTFLKMLKAGFENIKIEAMWNNLSKVGLANSNPCGKGGSRGMVPDPIYHCVMEHFNVVKKEIDILKPDVIIFMAGRGADNKGYIENIFSEGVKYEPLEVDGVERVILPGINSLAYKISRHPSQGYSNEQRDTEFSAIISDIWQEITHREKYKSRTHKLL